MQALLDLREQGHDATLTTDENGRLRLSIERDETDGRTFFARLRSSKPLQVMTSVLAFLAAAIPLAREAAPANAQPTGQLREEDRLRSLLRDRSKDELGGLAYGLTSYTANPDAWILPSADQHYAVPSAPPSQDVQWMWPGNTPPDWLRIAEQLQASEPVVDLVDHGKVYATPSGYVQTNNNGKIIRVEPKSDP